MLSWVLFENNSLNRRFDLPLNRATLLVGDLRLRKALHHRDHLVARGLDRLVRRHRRGELERTRIVERQGARGHAGREPGLDQRDVEPARWFVGQDLADRLGGRELGVAGCRHVIQQTHDLNVAVAAQRHDALAVLHRLGGVGRLERRRRIGNAAEVAGDQAERLRLIELAGDHQHGVVGAIVFLVEPLERGRRHLLDVGARADRRLAVVVPEIGRRPHPFGQDVLGLVLTDLELVADDRELLVEIDLRDVRVDHAVGLELESP